MFIDYMNLEFIDLKLRYILLEIETEFGQKVFTSLFRINDPGVHGTLPLRGADLRERNQLVGNVIKGWVNSRWVYDASRPEKKVCKFHDTGKGLHIHVQVHRNTERK